jgi:hypothetical protein
VLAEDAINSDGDFARPCTIRTEALQKRALDELANGRSGNEASIV